MRRLLLLAALPALLLQTCMAALLECEITLCTSIDFTGYCKSWTTTLNASPKGDYRVVTNLPAIMAGNVHSFKYVCSPDPYDQRLALWRNTFVRMYRARNFTQAEEDVEYRKFYYQTGGFPRFVYRNMHTNITEELGHFEPYYEFSIYYNPWGAFKANLIPPDNPIYPVINPYYDDVEVYNGEVDIAFLDGDVTIEEDPVDSSGDGTQYGTDGTEGGSQDGTEGGSQDGTDGTEGGSQDGAEGGSQDGTGGGSQDGTDGTEGGSQDGSGTEGGDQNEEGHDDGTYYPPIYEMPEQ